MAKKIKYLRDQVVGDNYVRCWKEKGALVVQVWKGKTSPNGEPEGDWAMPSMLGVEAAVSQAIKQT